MAAEGKGEEEPAGGNIWEGLLREASSSASSSSDARVVVVGDPGSGKSALVDRLRRATFVAPDGPDAGGALPTSTASLLQVTYMSLLRATAGGAELHTDDAEALVNVWSINDPKRWAMLSFPLNGSIRKTVFVIVLDGAKPWSFEDSLGQWAEAIKRATQSAAADPAQVAAAQADMRDRVRAYGHDGEDTGLEADVEVPLPDGVLTANLGVPILVVVAKADVLTSGPQRGRASLSTSQLDFVQGFLRKWCLAYGASLAYVTSTANEGIERVARCVSHCVDPKSGPVPEAEVDAHRSVFVPSGWDSAARVADIAKDLDSAAFAERIPSREDAAAPKAPSISDEPEVVAVSEEAFLASIPVPDDSEAVAALNTASFEARDTRRSTRRTGITSAGAAGAAESPRSTRSTSSDLLDKLDQAQQPKQPAKRGESAAAGKGPGLDPTAFFARLRKSKPVKGEAKK